MIESRTDQSPKVTVLCPVCGGRCTDIRQAIVKGSRVVWEVYYCHDKECNALMLVEYPKKGEGPLTDGRIVYPYSVAHTLKGVPDKVKLNLDQAVRCLSAGAYNAATVMARACVEAIAKDKNAEGRDLEKKIEWLNEERIITPMLYEWAHSLRHWGNDAIHDMEPIDMNDANEIVQFARYMIEHLYVQPVEFEKIRRRPKAEE